MLAEFVAELQPCCMAKVDEDECAGILAVTLPLLGMDSPCVMHDSFNP